MDGCMHARTFTKLIVATMSRSLQAGSTIKSPRKKCPFSSQHNPIKLGKMLAFKFCMQTKKRDAQMIELALTLSQASKILDVTKLKAFDMTNINIPKNDNVSLIV